jgi:excisionase family DNA binding protein
MEIGIAPVDQKYRFGEELLSADEVAGYLELEPVTIYRWCRNGRLPCMKLGGVWRIRRRALEAFMRQAERPQTLVAHLGAFFGVPDQVLAVAEDANVLARLDAAFFQVAEAHDGLLVKFYDPRVASRDELRVGFRRDGLEIDRLEAAGRFRWCPEGDPAGEVASLRHLLTEEVPTGRPVWAGFNWLGDVELEDALRQQAELAELVATFPLAVMTGVVEPAVQDWPGAELQWRLLGSLRGVIRYSPTGLLLSRVVSPVEP